MLNHQRSHTQHLLNLLLSEPSNGNGSGRDQLMSTVPSGQGGVSAGERSEFSVLQEGRRKMLVLLDLVDFTSHAMPTPDMEYFDPAAVEDVVKLCKSIVRQEGGGGP